MINYCTKKYQRKSQYLLSIFKVIQLRKCKDTNEKKIKTYQKGIDPTNEVGNESIKETNVYFTSNSSEIKNAKFIIIAVPTPINIDKTPDLEPVIKASEIVGKNLQKGAIVVYTNLQFILG